MTTDRFLAGVATMAYLVRRGWISALVLLTLSTNAAAQSTHSRTIARCGEGFLEEIDGRKVLHVQGSPYAMGFQQGSMLRDDVRALVRFLFDEKAKELKLSIGNANANPKAIIKIISEGQKKFVPARFYEEMRGLADGSGLDYDEVVIANFIPEMFHCSGFAIAGTATRDGTLYHGRVLDYGTDWRLQDHALITVARPEGKIPFVNVAYAGFIGSVTGMNAEHVSVGEMGGRGMGHWAGVPMAFLMRMALEEAHTLDEAIAVFRDNPRTCEYYYVLADGKTGKAVGMEGTWAKFGTIAMGESHPRLPHAIPDAVVLSVGDRYEALAKRVQDGFGRFDPESAIRLMDRPVAMKSNLHNVLFEPKSTRFWVANASKEGEPAATQPYHAYRLDELLARSADPSAPALPPPPAETSR
ncbi:MAG: C45 family peptidase [Isosphaeraceae bacterium]